MGIASKETGKVSADSLVVVAEIDQVPCPSLGWCPCAWVTVVDESPEEGLTGWIRCSGKDGFDIIDSRNYNEVVQVKQRLQEEQEFVRAIEEARLLTTGQQGATTCQQGARRKRGRVDDLNS